MFKYYLIFHDFIHSIFNILISLVLNIFYIDCLFSKTFKINAYRVHILGNGTSLKQDYDLFLSISSKDDKILCLNKFANSPLFGETKPHLYVLVDPLFFTTPLDLSPVGLVWENLRDRVNWNMTLFIPCSFANCDNVKYIRKNKFIKVVTVKNVPIYGGFFVINALLFKLGLANPLFQNVLIASIFLSIKVGFKDIFIWGADHTWLENVTVESDNKIYIKDTHFYEPCKEKELFAPLNDKMRVDISLASYQRCFRLYHDLRKYASLSKVRVVNCSSISWIDAFERIQR
jgi:hypothetical protein